MFAWCSNFSFVKFLDLSVLFLFFLAIGYKSANGYKMHFLENGSSLAKYQINYISLSDLWLESCGAILEDIIQGLLSDVIFSDNWALF